MQFLPPYEIPVLHPLAVHFPLALLPAAALAALGWVVRGTAFWRRAALLIGFLGLCGAAFAYFTGDAMAAHVEGAPIVEEVVEQHETLALSTFVASGVAVALLLGLSVRIERAQRRRVGMAHPEASLAVRLLALAVVGVASLLVAWTGHLGGIMVWGVPGG